MICFVFFVVLVFSYIVVLHDMLANFVNIQIHAIPDPDHDVKTVAHARSHFVTEHRCSFASVRSAIRHRFAKYRRKMHAIHRRASTAARVYWNRWTNTRVRVHKDIQVCSIRFFAVAYKAIVNYFNVRRQTLWKAKFVRIVTVSKRWHMYIVANGQFQVSLSEGVQRANVHWRRGRVFVESMQTWREMPKYARII